MEVFAAPTVEALEPRLLLSGQPLITEFMAINDSTLQDEHGEYSDWLEVHNPSTSSIDLTGWGLTDDDDEDPADRDVWRFPSMTLGPGEFRVIFASGTSQTDPAGELHVDFKLSGGGEYLALMDPDDNVVQEFAPFPGQHEDISYGIAQNVEVTELLPGGADAKYLVPTNGDLGLSWTAADFADDAWAEGQTGIGYEDMLPGFAVWNYKASVSVGHLSTAKAVVGPPASSYSAVYSENAPVIDYFNTGGMGHFGGNTTFPGLFVGTDADDFVVEARAVVTIPAAGQWTFGVNSDDGFSLELTNGADTFYMEYPDPRGPADTIQVFNFSQAGDYDLRLIFYERGGGSEVELFAAQGSHPSFDGSFHLVGDTAGGGLAVRSQPVNAGGGSTGGGFSGLVETDVKDAMKGTNASLYVRLPFDVADPSAYESLTLRMKYDDGYVAYLNGVKVAERNAPALPQWYSIATDERDEAQVTRWENVDLTDSLDELRTGENVLAIHAMNVSADDGDLLILPEMAEIKYTGLGEHYFADATPGDANSEEFWARVEDTRFSVDRGFYDEPFYVEISTDTDGAEIYYTTDGSSPLLNDGAVSPDANEYLGRIYIATTTMLRAAAVLEAYEPTNVDTHTYIFLADVLQQPADPDGFPSAWRGEAADYEMDPEVVNDLVYSETLLEDLKSIPTMSLVMDIDDLFGDAQGIYSNPTSEGVGWERPGSIELIHPDGTEGFQVNAGVRIYGGVGRQPTYKKHTFRLLFKADYGPTKLDYPLFGEGAADQFDTIILRSGFNDAYVWGGPRSQYILDEYVRQLQLALGQPSGHGTFVHLYVNGLYWGLYNPVERPESSFSATYFGGDKEDWDALNSGEPIGESSSATWNQMLNLVRQGLEAEENYQRLQGNNPDGTPNPDYVDYLDLENYIDYLLANFYAGNRDWPGHNWYAAMNRVNPTGFKSYSWDAEWVVGLNSGVNENRTGVNNSLCEPYAYLRQNAEFRLLFADRAHQAFFNGGALYVDPAHPQWDPAHPERNQPAALYASLAAVIERAMVAESARWGDVKSAVPYDLEDWRSQRDWAFNSYMPVRSDIVLQQLRSAGLYPNAVAPEFRVNGAYQHGGTFTPGDALSMYAPAGTIYYTLDGSDPRLPGGAVSGTAGPYAGTVPLTNSAHVRARVLHNGEWSALNEASYLPETVLDLRITEVMYNPAPLTPEEIAAEFTDKEQFEFIEIQNTGDQTVDLEGLHFGDGVVFTFPHVEVAPGGYVVVVRNRDAFEFRYGTSVAVIAGEFVDSALRNEGERLSLDAPVGGIIHAFEYNDAWYDITDGEGFSLTIRDPGGEADLWNRKEGWRPSETVGGTPGRGDQGIDPGSILITEALAHSDGTYGDWIELYNATDHSINIGGWFLSDSADELTKYTIPAGATIHSGQYLVLTEAQHFGVGPNGFRLSEFGDDVYLCSGVGGAPGGYREHVDFGASPNSVSFGLYEKTTGGTDFTLMQTLTPWTLNGEPFIGPLLLNEVMYHPSEPPEGSPYSDADFEFVELYNAGLTTLTLTEFIVSSGIGFTFGWYDTDSLDTAMWTLQAGAAAGWQAYLPAPGDYEVFAWWDAYDTEGNRRSLDPAAVYEITHADGSSLREVNQDLEDHSGEWVSLGSYSFERGFADVTVTRGTLQPGHWTLADQVKFVRGGIEVVVDDDSVGFWTSEAAVTSLAPGEYVVLVNNLAAFGTRYDVAGAGIAIAGEYTGSLNNGGEKVKLLRRGIPEDTGYIPYIRNDYVNYNDRLPWPTEPDGSGPSLNRVAPDSYGNDAGSWASSNAGGTPGAENVSIDTTPPLAPTGLTGRVLLDGETRIELSWDASIEPQSYVTHYVVYRDGDAYGSSETTGFTDTDVDTAVVHTYRVFAVNRDGYVSEPSDPIEVGVPGIDSISAPDEYTVRIRFTEPLDRSSAEQTGNYVFGNLTVVAATLLPDSVTVSLMTSELQNGQLYTVTVNGVQTFSGNVMPPDLQESFVYSPLGSGSILREYWNGIDGNGVSLLTGHPNFPNNPSGRSFPEIFEAPVNWSNSYGTRMRGYLHPPATGEYVFWISSDDNSQLFLSTDESPDNKVLIAHVPGWTNPRQWDRYGEQRSAPVYLEAGRRYYIEALQKEGSGGDNLAVGWQLPDGTLERPIPGLRLSPWEQDVTAPAADILDVQPDPRMMPVDEIRIIFSEWVDGLDAADLALRRDGGPNLLTGTELLTTGDHVSWTLHGLTSLTAAEGTYQLILQAAGSGIADKAGNPLSANATDTWIVDSGLPVVAVLGSVTKDPTPALFGTINDPAADVTVTIEGDATEYPAINHGNGTWSVPNDTIAPLADGTYDVHVVATNAVGSDSDKTIDELTVDTVVPTITVDALLTRDTTPRLSGTVDDPLAAVQITVRGISYTATNRGDGTWILPDDTIGPPFLDGTYDVEAAAADSAGNTGTDVTDDELTVDTTPPTVTVDSLSINDATPPLSGTVDDPAATVTVTVGGSTYPAVNQGDGTWTLADDVITPALDDGVHDVIATATDPAGNAASDETVDELAIDAQPPAVTVEPLLTTDTTPPLNGTVDDIYATVVVTIEGHPTAYEATVLRNGTWSVPDDAIGPLDDGTYDVHVAATDVAGNTGYDTTADELVIDRAEPVVTFDRLTTSDPSPALLGTVDDPAASVMVFVDYPARPYVEAVNHGDGTWSLPAGAIAPALIDGVHAIMVGAVDLCGNAGFDLDYEGLVIDMIAPLVTVDALITADGAPRLTGTVNDPRATIVVSVDGVPYAATNQGSGAWFVPAGTISPALDDGVYDVEAVAADEAGNVGRDATTDELIVAVAPTVLAFERNGGAERPDELTSLALRFSEDVSASLDVGDLTLRNDATGSEASPTSSSFVYYHETHTARWDLSDATLAPGYYTVVLSAAGVTDAAGLPLDGNGDGTAGDDFEASVMIAATGDTNLDGAVDMLDYLAVKRHYGQGGATWAEGDFDHDGQVTYDDYAAGRDNFGAALSTGGAAVLAPAQAPARAAPAPDATEDAATGEPATDFRSAEAYALEAEPAGATDAAALGGKPTPAVEIGVLRPAPLPPLLPGLPARDPTDALVEAVPYEPVEVAPPAADSAQVDLEPIDAIAAALRLPLGV